MMRKGTDKKRGAAICAGVIILLIVTYFSAILFLLFGSGTVDLALLMAAVFYGGIFLAIISGILIALMQRFKEIDNGEEEDAKKY